MSEIKLPEDCPQELLDAASWAKALSQKDLEDLITGGANEIVELRRHNQVLQAEQSLVVSRLAKVVKERDDHYHELVQLRMRVQVLEREKEQLEVQLSETQQSMEDYTAYDRACFKEMD